MGDTTTLKATKRDLKGDKPNAIRAAGNTPAVIHDHGKDSHHVVINTIDLVKAYRSAGKHHTVDLDVEGKKYTALIKDVTHKPGTYNVTHTVFQAVKANETVTAEVPLKLVGEIPAERASLLVVTGVDRLEVEALPKDLVDVIEIDASSLAVAGDRLLISDITAPKGMVIKNDPETLVAHVETPRDQIAEADAANAEQAAADGNVAVEEDTTETAEEE